MTEDELYAKIWRESMERRNGCNQPVVVAIVIAIIIALSSCATKTKVEYVDREVVKYQKEITHDTLYQHTHDSIYHTIYQKGDTVFDTKYVEKTKWRDKVGYRIDTCYKDSIRTQIKETTVEKTKIPKWCWLSLIACFVIIIFEVLKITKWITKF